MNVIRSSHNFRIAMPSSIINTQDAGAWLASMSDSGWRVLTDFRNWSNWIPGVRSVKQADSESPARGTKLLVETGHKTTTGSIDRWDPPQSLQISINLAAGEIAYGFLIEVNPKTAEMCISLELERSLNGISRIAAFFFQWQQQKLGRQILSNLAARTRPAKNL
ncbi:MAG: SRPBCC family protein [Gammaproteobacteria bacterium]|nr:SRPBCC family protein [Gammaproteobacteria bacterium]